MTGLLPDAFLYHISSLPSLSHIQCSHNSHTHSHTYSHVPYTLPHSITHPFSYDPRVLHSHALIHTPPTSTHSWHPFSHTHLLTPLLRVLCTFSRAPPQQLTQQHSGENMPPSPLPALCGTCYLFFPASFSDMRKLWYREVTSPSQCMGRVYLLTLWWCHLPISVCNSCGELAVTPDSYKAAVSHSPHSLAIRRMGILQAVFQASLLLSCPAPLN